MAGFKVDDGFLSGLAHLEGGEAHLLLVTRELLVDPQMYILIISYMSLRKTNTTVINTVTASDFQ